MSADAVTWEPRGQVLDPLPDNHPAQLTHECLICNAPLGEDGPVQELWLSPTDVVLVGEPCLHGLSDPELVALINELAADDSWRPVEVVDPVESDESATWELWLTWDDNTQACLSGDGVPVSQARIEAATAVLTGLMPALSPELDTEVRAILTGVATQVHEASCDGTTTPDGQACECGAWTRKGANTR